MRGRVKGDFDVLEAWRRTLETAPALLTSMSASMAEETIGLITEGFRSETDPYGDTWTPKKRPDGRQTLSGKTARLRRWHIVRSSKGGWTVAPTAAYAGAHQNPRRRPGWGQSPGSLTALPQRMMIPTRSRGLPPSWAAAYRETAVDTLRTHFAASSRAAGGGGMSFITAKIAGIKRSFNAMALVRRALRAVEGNG